VRHWKSKIKKEINMIYSHNPIQVMKLSSIDKNAMQVLRPEIDKALKLIATKYGIQMNTARGTFDNSTGTFKIDINTILDDGTVMTKEAKDFVDYEWKHSLDKTDLWKYFSYFGIKYQIVGFKVKSRKRNIIIESQRNDNGQCRKKQFVMSDDDIRYEKENGYGLMTEEQYEEKLKKQQNGEPAKPIKTSYVQSF
jgi:hypothetical protein